MGESVNPHPDSILPDAALALSEEEFARQAEEIRALLWVIAAGVLGDRAGAEDVVQDALIIGLQKREQFERGTKFKAWMSQITRHVASNHRRKRMRHPTVALREEAMNVTTKNATPSRSLVESNGVLRIEQDEFDDKVMDSLNQLGETARACLLLRTLRGESYADIGQALDIPKGTAMSHVHRSRFAMREMLRKSANLKKGGKKS